MVIGHRENDLGEARSIVDAIRKFQSNPQLRQEAQADIPAVLDRLGLSGTVRHAVAATLAMGICGVVAMPGTPVYWSA